VLIAAAAAPLELLALGFGGLAVVVAVGTAVAALSARRAPHAADDQAEEEAPR
jgi:hypothetical protein